MNPSILVAAPSNNAHKPCLNLHLNFKRLLSMIFIISSSKASAFVPTADYTSLLPGQHFYANSIVGTSVIPTRLSYGGWFQGIGTALKLNDLTYFDDGPLNVNFTSVVQYKVAGGFNTKIPANTWVFVMWNKASSGPIKYLNNFNGTNTEFCIANMENAYSTHYFNASAVGTDKDIAPIYFGDADINGTSWFEVSPTSLRQSGLFYAVLSNISALYDRVPQYMMGPYKGAKRAHNAIKFNIGITTMTMSDSLPPYSPYSNTTKSLQQSLVNMYGTYLPNTKYIEYQNFLDPAVNQWTSEPDNMRIIYVQFRFNKNETNPHNQNLNNVNAAYQFAHVNFRQSSSSTQTLTISFMIQRSTSTAVCMIKLNNVYVRGGSLNSIFQSDAVSGVSYSMKIAMVLAQNSTELSMSSPSVNLILEFVSRDSTSYVIKQASGVFPNLKVPFNPFGKVHVGVTHEQNSSTTGILILNLEYLYELRGGFFYQEIGLSATSDNKSCLSQTAFFDGTETKFYCTSCQIGSIQDVNTGLCVNGTLITGKNTTCQYYLSVNNCYSCNVIDYWISQVQRVCTEKANGCDPVTHEWAYAYDTDNMRRQSCNDVKYFDVAAGCTQYSNPVPGGTTCACEISNCKTCVHTQCDECKTGYSLLVKADLFVCMNSAVSGYGMDSDVVQYFKPCLVANCANCEGNYRVCTQCALPYVLDSSTNNCVLCSMNNNRYWNSLTNVCSPCDSSCVTCDGAGPTNCLTCPTDKYLRTADKRCTVCDNTSETFTAPNGTVFAVFINRPACSLCDISCGSCVDITYCTSCAVGYYRYLNNSCGTCTEAGMYKNLVSPLFPSCSSCTTSCATCNGSSSNCTSCSAAGMILFANGTCGVCAVGHYASNGICQKCNAACLACTGGTNLDCTSCAGTYFLYDDSGNRCGDCTEVGFYPIVDLGNKCRKCDPSCVGCFAGQPKQCSTCAYGYLSASNGTCKICNTSGPFYINNSSCVDCHTSCATCVGSTNSSCTSCNANKYLGDDKMCTTCTVSGYYKDDSNLSAPRCKLCPTTCATCDGPAATNCLTCASGKFLTVKRECTECKKTGMFVRQDNLTCDSCDGNCVKCSTTSTNCTECDTANGYILVNGSCAIPSNTSSLQCISTPVASASVVLSLLLTPSEPWTQNVTQSALESIKIAAVWTSNVPADFTVYSVGSGLQVDVRGTAFSTSAPKTVVLDISWPDTNITVESRQVKLGKGGCSREYVRGASLEEIKTSESQAAVVSGLTSTMSSTDSAVGMSLMGTLLAADPTGTFFRFTKILQIVNKLYFININYGKRLEAFLAKTSSVSKTEIPIENIKNYRGKLNQYKVTLDFVAAMSDKVVLYLISWILKGVKRLLLDNCIMGKIGIYFCHYANRAHLIIFNLVFIDFIWLAPRTLMHARSLPGIKDSLAILVMCLIAADLCLILSHLLDDRIWRKALEHYTSLKEFCPIPETSVKGESNNSALPLNEPGSAPKQDDPNQDQTKQINYKKTYFEIDFNVHLMDMATNTLRVDESVFQSMLCRALMTAIWWRVIVLQLTILSCQYANTLGLTVLLIIELSRLFATIYAYLKYKYLKNIICLLMEVLNSLSVGLFFLNALLISPKRFDELIMDFYQDAGIWIVIASCVAEYLLLLTYIGVATYDFFKNRKMMKRMNAHYKNYALIATKYVKKPASPNAPSLLPLTGHANDSSGLCLTNATTNKPKFRSIVKTKGRLLTSIRPAKRGVEPLFKNIHFKPL